MSRCRKSWTPEQRNLVSRLEKLSGKAFDREYLKAMISDHTKDISEFEREASQATNPEIKQICVRGAANAAQSPEDGARVGRQGRASRLNDPRHAPAIKSAEVLNESDSARRNNITFSWRAESFFLCRRHSGD